jgi:sucrose-6-phosphate hydrolase SacC (GH32 family)
MKMLIDGEVVRDFDIELPEGEPEFWAFMDVTEFTGKKATFEVDPPMDDLVIAASDTIVGAEDLYREPLRSQFHFSTRRGWNNDPNGLVFYKGEYHLFYQHNPYGWGWGNMHWGHAVSKDLVHWEELPIAIYPDALGTIFSGSAVVDEANTTGFQTGEEKPIVTVYTYAGEPFTQGIAYSIDCGRTWTKFDGNPVIGNITGGSDRDPRILWHEPTGQWALVLYLDEEGNNRHGFFTSPDMKTWTQHSEISGFFECPDLFELPVDGDPSNTRWVVYGAAGEYLLGAFDGKTFTPEPERLPLSYGNCFYAAQTFSNIPDSDGRRIQIGWGQTVTEGMPFNQMMLVATVLTLKTTPDGIRMFVEPVAEIEALYDKTHTFSGETVGEDNDLLAGIQGDLFDIAVEFDAASATEVGINIRGIEVTFDAANGEVKCLDKTAPLAAEGGKLTLRLLVDRNSIEIFAGDGLVYMPMAVKFEADSKPLALIARGGEVTVRTLAVRELKSIWR